MSDFEDMLDDAKKGGKYQIGELILRIDPEHDDAKELFTECASQKGRSTQYCKTVLESL